MRWPMSRRTKAIKFAGACELLDRRTPDLTSANLAIRFKAEGNEMDRMLARGKVVIVQEAKEGRGRGGRL